ncbi:DUF1203 domain-containing protein [Streptomyces sp. NPDC059373]
MDHMEKTRYEIRAIAPDVLRKLRDHDDAGNRPQLVVDEEGGSPLRCCFGRSKPGETVALASYAPLRRWAEETGAAPGPYSEVGPVFVHAEDCGGPTGSGFPADMRGDRRVLRAYTADGRILRGRYVEGGAGRPTIEEELEELYRDPAVAAVHLRAVEFGCFLLETRRR